MEAGKDHYYSGLKSIFTKNQDVDVIHWIFNQNSELFYLFQYISKQYSPFKKNHSNVISDLLYESIIFTRNIFLQN